MSPVLLALVMLALGAAALVVGAEWFADNVTSAARRVGLTTLALGVLVAGAEPEEALTAAIASVQGQPALAVGDALGANLVMLTLVLGLALLLTPLEVGRRVRGYAAAAAAAGVLALLGLADGVISRGEGGGLLTVYAVAMVVVWRREQAPAVIGSPSTENSAAGDRPPAAALLLVVAGTALMVFGGWLAVRGATAVVAASGLADSAVGLTLLALATSAEMLALVVAAARAGLTEVAVAGLVGAVGYNATVSLGVGAVVAPLQVSGGLVGGGLVGGDLVGGDTVLLAVAAVTAALPWVLWLVPQLPEVPRRLLGAVLVGGYLTAVPALLLLL